MTYHFFEKSLSQVDQTLTIADLSISYRNPEAVKTYLTHNPEIEKFLGESQPALVSCFERPVDIVLELIVDPEDGHEHLVGWIQSTDAVNKALEKLERFDEDWFLDHINDIGDKFSFNLESQ
jgi:hypothetical protein